MELIHAGIGAMSDNSLVVSVEDIEASDIIKVLECTAEILSLIAEVMSIKVIIFYR